MVPDEPFIDLSEDVYDNEEEQEKNGEIPKKKKTETKLYQFLNYLFPKSELCMLIKIKYNFRVHRVVLVAMAAVVLVWENFANP